jgi:hypothetical protein
MIRGSSKLPEVWPPVWHRGSPAQGRRILFTKPWIFHWSWVRRPSFLTSARPRHEVLFAGPWVGEFGWELMNWQGFVRALRNRYRKVIVCSRASSRALYEDVCDLFIPHTVKGQSNSHVIFDIQNPGELQRVFSCIPEDADVLFPLRYVPAHAQSFIRFGNASIAGKTPEVLLHARGRHYQPGRNWPISKWIELADGLVADGYQVGSIGLSSDASLVPGTEDLRDQSLHEIMNKIAASRLVVGPSSGPMHLASLCGTPHLVWTDTRTYGMGLTSRAKYETAWNPLQTPVQVLDQDGFDPPVRQVAATAREMLAHVG